MNNVPCLVRDSVKAAIYLACLGILLLKLMNQNSECRSSSIVINLNKQSAWWKMVQKWTVVKFYKFNLQHSYLICYHLSKRMYSNINGPWLSCFREPNILITFIQALWYLWDCLIKVVSWCLTSFFVSKTRNLTKLLPTKCWICHFLS